MRRSESKPTNGSRPCSATGSNNPEEAEKTIENMVKSDPENYHVYLQRGHFRLSTPVPSQRDSRVSVAKQDFQKALKRAPNEPDVYLELANADSLSEAGYDATRHVLEDGLKHVPKPRRHFTRLSPTVSCAPATIDKAVATLNAA